jgi:NhaP-type Na+/H+ or K+/H+ antiporter
MALLQEFQIAARDEKIRASIAGALVGVGIAWALYLLLKHLEDEKE